MIAASFPGAMPGMSALKVFDRELMLFCPAQNLKARTQRTLAEEVEALGRRCLKIWCDLTVSEQIESMAGRISGFGRRKLHYRAGL